MKKIISIIVLLSLSLITSRAAVTLNIDAGILYQPNGSTLAPNGSLIVVAASTLDGSFSMPTPSSFVTNDDVVLAKLALNSLNQPGSHSESLIISYSGSLGAGDPVAIFWYPTLTQTATSPGFNTPYGMYQFSTLLPGDGGLIDLTFQTASFFGGLLPDSMGIANLTTIPEPSTYALIGFGILTLSYIARRRSKLS